MHRRGPAGRSVAALAGALALASCSADPGPPALREARFAVVPTFQSEAAQIVDVARIRFLVVRTADASVAKDTVVEIPPGQDSVDVQLPVVVQAENETFLLTLALVTAQGDTVFRGGPTEVTASPPGAAAPPAIPIGVVYVGVGFDAAEVVILTPDTSGFTGDAIVFSAVALDSAEAPIPGTPIAWRSLDGPQASVPNRDSGRVVAGATRGTARIVAELLTGQLDTARLAVQPLPSAIAVQSGSGQSGPPGALLGQPLVARVTAPDAGGVAGVYVRFAIGQGGGTLSADSARTDSSGAASVSWTLGLTAGPQTVVATTPRLPAQTATFNATAVGGAPGRTVAWVNPASGNWSDAANWSTGTVPAMEDTVVIDASGTYTVTVDVNATVALLLLVASTGTQTLTIPGTTLTVTDSAGIGVNGVLDVAGGTFTGLGLTSVRGGHQWTAGTIAGTGSTQIETGGTLTVGGAAAKTLDAHTLRVAGTVQWSGTGNVTAANNAVIVNEASGTFNVQAPASLIGGPSPFQNLGTLIRSGTDTTTINMPFDNDGTVDVAGGTLHLIGPSGTSTGTFTIQAGQSLQFGNGTHDLLAGSSVSGAGDVAVGPFGIMTIGGDYAITGTTTTFALGEAIFSSATPSTTTNLTMSGGTVDGTGTLSVSGVWNWPNGVMRGMGTTIVEAAATLNITTTSTVQLIDRTIQNAGTTTWSGTGVVGGASGVFENQATGTFSAQSNASWVQNLAGSLPRFTNAGSVTRSGAGTSTFAITFDNAGSVAVQGGALSLTRGGTSGGTFTVQTGATLNLAGTHDIQAGAALSGAGTVQVSADSAVVRGSYNLTGRTRVTGGAAVFSLGDTVRSRVVELSGGILDVTNLDAPTVTLLLVSDSLLWTGGTLETSGGLGGIETESTAGNLIDGTAAKLHSANTVLGGSTIWRGSGNVDGQGAIGVTIPAGASFDVQTDASFGAGATAGAFLTNNGTVVKSAGAGAATIAILLTNAAVLDVQTGTLAPTAGFAHQAGATIQGSATLDLSAATVTAFDGAVNPGTSPGALAIVGDVTPSASVAFTLEIAGPTPGTEADQLNVSGQLDFGAAPVLNLVGAATLTPGDAATILTFGSALGQGDNITGLDQWTPLGLGFTFDTAWSATSMTVVANSQILFSGQTGAGGLFRTNAHRDFQVNVTTEGQFPDAAPRWSPDLTRITHTANNQLHVVEAAAFSTPAHLLVTDVDAASTQRARFSPDGRHLAFECGSGFGDVCTIDGVDATPISVLDGIGDPGGASPKVIVTDAGVLANLTGTPAYAWDPTNPNRLAVVRDSAVGSPAVRTVSQIWLVDFDGSNPTPVNSSILIDGTDSLRVFSMDWSPDGSFIVFAAQPQNTFTNRALYRLEVGTGAITALTTLGGDDDELPRISPDGSTVLFVRHDFLSEGSDFNLWTIPSAGGAETQLTAEFALIFFSPDEIGFDWSPDGSAIVLTGTDGTTPGIYVIDAAATTPTNYLATRRLVGRGPSLSDVHASWRP